MSDSKDTSLNHSRGCDNVNFSKVRLLVNNDSNDMFRFERNVYKKS